MRFPKYLYAIGLGPIIGHLILILITVGRRTGKPHATPLQYEEVEGVYYIGSARGEKADWYQNISKNPHVKVRVKSDIFHAYAEPILEPDRIADFLELRLERHPKMLGAMLRSEGLPSQPSRSQLEGFAQKTALVALRPLNGEDGVEYRRGVTQ